MRFLLLLCLVLAAPVWAAETMRIAVGAEVSELVLSGTPLLCGSDADDATLERVSGDRLVVRRATLDSKLSRCRSGDAVLMVGDARLRGDVVVLAGRTGVQAVNVIALEDYLTGVLGSEMPSSFPEEALKAQAVAARTYALNKKLDQYGSPFHLGSSVISQVYRGLEAEDPRTRAAVEATRGVVITWMLQPIEAYFHSSCGGRTESGLDALNRDLPYLQPVDCPCGSLPSSHWKLKLTNDEVRRLGASRVDVVGRTPTGRVRKVQLGSKLVDAVTFRERVGYMRLKSLSFSVEHSRDGWVLEGSGFGHGAGLCQWGARAYAEKGWSYDRILRHYYPNTELQTLY